MPFKNVMVVALTWAVVIAAWVAFKPARAPDFEARAKHVRAGMNRAEVEAVMGCPKGVYCTRPGSFLMHGTYHGGLFLPPPWPVWSHWTDDECTIGVAFGEQGTAEDVSIQLHGRLGPQTPIEWVKTKVSW